MRVNISELAQLDSAFRNSANKMVEVQESLLQLSRSIGREQVGERFRPAVQHVTELAVGHTRDLVMMGSVLDSILKEYAQTEQGICTKAEEEGFGFIRMATGLLPLPEMERIPHWLDTDGDGDGMILWIPWFPPD